MHKEVFDQDRPQRRSAMAQRLDDAFAGCEEWTIAPATPRHDEVDLAPWLSGGSQAIDRTVAARPESRAA